MKIIKKLTFVFIFFFSSLSNGQFIPEQIDSTKSVVEKKGESIIGFYVLLSQPYESFKKTKNYCDNLVRHGAQPPSKKFEEMMNKTYPTILKELNQCHVKVVGRSISSSDIKQYKDENQNTGSELMDLFGSLTDMGALNSAPKTRKDLDKCSGDEMFLNLYLKSFRDSSGYPDKNWCSNLVSKK